MKKCMQMGGLETAGEMYQITFHFLQFQAWLYPSVKYRRALGKRNNGKFAENLPHKKLDLSVFFFSAL